MSYYFIFIQEVKTIMRRLAEAVKYMHDKGKYLLPAWTLSGYCANCNH